MNKFQNTRQQKQLAREVSASTILFYKIKNINRVKLATFNGRNYAIKFSTSNNAYSSQVLKRIFQKQAYILQQLNNPHIIKLHEVIINGKYTRRNSQQIQQWSGLVFEYAPYNLSQILQLGSLQQCICRTIFLELLQGIQYIHSKNIIHRDIKPANLLFDMNYNIKICDFGLSTLVDPSNNKPKTICGSDSFKSPQMLMKKNYNGVMNDLFAAGVTLFILMTGNPPFSKATPNAGLYQFIALNYYDKFWKSHDKNNKFSLQFKNLINSMLSFDPTHRLSIAQILSHQWMRGQTLMSNDLYDKMKIKQLELLQKKRKIQQKSMKNKIPKLGMNNNKVNRSSMILMKEQFKLIKLKYNKQYAKLTDRLVTKMMNVQQLGYLFYGLGKLFNNENNQLQLHKTIHYQQISPSLFTLQQLNQQFNQNQDQKLIIQIILQQYDEQTDCLKFILKQGNIGQYMKLLNQFDFKILAYSNQEDSKKQQGK